MARRPRREKEGQLHHVVVRGHNGSPIITRSEDAASLLGRLADAFSARGIPVWMWALLINHLHLVAKGSIERLSEAMRIATGPYARDQNERAGARGSFFQDRFWSRPIESERDARTSVIYVARNSLTAGHVRSAEGLERHPFCGYGALFAEEPDIIIPVETAAVLGLFGTTPESARDAVRESMEASIAQWEADKTDTRLAAIIRRVAAERGLPPEVLRTKSRDRWVTDARMQVVGEAIAAGVSSSVIASELNVSRQAVWKLRKRLSRPVDDRMDGWRLRLGV